MSPLTSSSWLYWSAVSYLAQVIVGPERLDDLLEHVAVAARALVVDGDDGVVLRHLDAVTEHAAEATSTDSVRESSAHGMNRIWADLFLRESNLSE